MVWTVVASTMMLIGLLTPLPINQYIQTVSLLSLVSLLSIEVFCQASSGNLALENLRKDKDCIIVTADKGVALVVMDKTEYIIKCEALLQDDSFYQHLSKDTSPTIYKELIKILQDYKNNNLISQTEYIQLRPHGSNSPAARFYGLLVLKSTKTTCLCTP